MQELKKIIVCADDFGLSPTLNRGIIDAARAHSISAISCMSAAPFWIDGAKLLKEPDASTAIGLHLCLSGLKSLADNKTMPSFSQLLKLACTKRLPEKEIEKEIMAQIESFIRLTGKSPAFIDGHMHVHQFPTIKDIVINEALEHGAWVRNTHERTGVILRRGVCRTKAFCLARPGKKMKTALERAGIKTNSGFTGIYNFSPAADYAQTAEMFLRQVSNGTLFMVHPGYADNELARLDPNTDSREKELAFLLSNDFEELLKKNNIAITASL